MSNKLSRSELVKRILYWIVMISFIFALIYVPLRAIFDEGYRENSEYKIMIFQTILGLLVINLPSFLTKRFMWKIPNYFSAVFMLFLWASIFCGEVMKFYYTVDFWDAALHLLSSMMLGILGFSMIEILNNDRKHALVNLSPFFVAVFSVSFAVLVGVLWEFYEYIFDGVLGLNMQKFAFESVTEGEKLTNYIGREALTDTMQDLIIDFIGATGVSIFGYFSLKYKKGWLEAFKVEIFNTPPALTEGDTDNKNDELAEYTDASALGEDELHEPPLLIGEEERELTPVASSSSEEA